MEFFYLVHFSGLCNGVLLQVTDFSGQRLGEQQAKEHFDFSKNTTPASGLTWLLIRGEIT